MLNKFPNSWNKHFFEKFEEFAKQPTAFRSVATAQTIITREMIRLCLQENQRIYIKVVTLYCEDIKELGQYGCENYSNYRPKRKTNPKKEFKKTTPKRKPKK